MAEIVNLRQARKRKARANKAEKAAENRAMFGQTKAEKARAVRQKEEQSSHLDRHALNRPGSNENSEGDQG